MSVTGELVEPAAWRSAPWGDAQGTSHEIRRWPDGDGDGAYLARVSIAEIDRSGPFTALPGYRRWLAVLDDGGGLALAIDARTWRGVVGDSVAFDGADAVHATITRPARVWNLIARADVTWTAAWHPSPRTRALPAGVAVVHTVATGVTRIVTSAQPIDLAVETAPVIVAHLRLP